MLKLAVDWLLYSLAGLNPASRLSESVNFFVYDAVKIILLLFVMISVTGFLRTYLSPNKLKKWLSGKRRLTGNFLASLFGAVTPFCSCSSIPIFMSFIEAGVPLGTAFSFLITSPVINEYLVVLMIGFFGFKITLIYVLSGLAIGTFAGFIMGKMNLERHLVKDMRIKNKGIGKAVSYKTFKSRAIFGFNEAKSIVKKLWLWVLIGVGVGAVIHNYVPEQAIHSIIGAAGIFSVPIATIIGVPMYGSCAAIVPIAVVLFQKGVPLGTALSFMMAVAALSLPEAIILRRVMKLKLIAIFFGIVTLAIIFTGYLLNFIQAYGI